MLAKALVSVAGFLGAGAVAGAFNGSGYFLIPIPVLHTPLTTTPSSPVIRIGRDATRTFDTVKELKYAVVGVMATEVRDVVENK
jgi:hypothetical protein